MNKDSLQDKPTPRECNQQPFTSSAAEGALRDRCKVRLVLPPTIYAATGIETNIYFDNTVLAPNYRNYTFEASCDKGVQFDERWSVTPELHDIGNHPIELKVRDETGNAICLAQSTLHVSGNNRSIGDATTLLLIGDSLTSAGGYSRRLMELCDSERSLHLKLIGSQSFKYDAGLGEAQHEGHPGWKAQSFMTPPVPATPAQDSPFFNPVRNRDGCPRFDLVPYFQKINEGRPPNAVVTFLGTNDVFLETDESIEGCLDTMLGYYSAMFSERDTVKSCGRHPHLKRLV